MKKALKIAARLLAALLVLLLCASLALSVIPLTETGDQTAVEGSADWMAALPDEKLLSELVIPGTHDSATQYVQLGFFSKCQSLSIGEQLSAGCRYLDIRLGSEGVELLLMHGFTKCRTGAMPWTDSLRLEDVLAQCYRFLSEHPTEVVLFAVKQEHGDLSVPAFETLLDERIRANEDRWLLTDTIPTLGEARGKLVLLRRYEDAAGLGARSGIPFLWANQNGYEDPSLNASAEDQGDYVLWVQDRYEYAADAKWSAFREGMDAARTREAGDIAVHFLSTKGTFAYGHPYRFAAALNKKLMDDAFTPDGWVIVDFLSAPLASRIYSANS